MSRGRFVDAANRFLESDAVHRWVESRALNHRGLVGGSHPAVTDVQRYNRAETTTFSAPGSTSRVPEAIANRPRRWTAPEWTVCECRDVQLVGPEGLTFLPDGGLLLENSLGWTKRAAVSAARSLVAGTLPMRRTGPADVLDTAVSLVGPWTDNFYHWHVDYLSRLAPVLRSDAELPRLLLPPGTTSWMKKSLRLLGFTNDDWRVLPGTRTTVENLVVPTLPRATLETAGELEYLEFTYNPASLRVIASEMRSRSEGSLPPELEDVDRLFVSRRGAGQRYVRNRYELDPVLEEYGVTVVRPEQYGVPTQVRLFSNTELVVGPHGAGLTNLLFTEDAACVELFGEYVHPAFYALAEHLGVDYTCINGSAAGDGMSIAPARLREGLELALEH